MATTSRSADLTSGPMLQKIILFSVPLAASSILQLLFNAADVVVVGRFAGSTALAAVGSNGALINLLVNLFVGLSLGANVVAARCFGARDEKGVQDTVHTAVALGLVSGVLLAVVGFCTARGLLELMSCPEDVIGLSTLYLRIYFIGMPMTMLYNFSSALLRAVGDTKRPLYCLAAAGIINVVLNLVFVIGFSMSVAGVALATIISQTVSALLVTGMLVREKGALRLAQAVQGIPGCTLAVAGTGPEEAALAAAKYAAAYELAQLQQNGEGLTGHAKEAYDKALADAAAAIEAAKTPAEVDAALAAAREALNNAVCPSAAFTDVEENVWYHDGIDFMVRNGYMNGVAADTFDVEGSLTRAQLVTILYRIAGEPETSAAIPFADVADGQWYTKAIVWAAENGIVKGVNETTFAPNDPITREHPLPLCARGEHRGRQAHELPRRKGHLRLRAGGHELGGRQRPHQRL